MLFFLSDQNRTLIKMHDSPTSQPSAKLVKLCRIYVHGLVCPIHVSLCALCAYSSIGCSCLAGASLFMRSCGTVHLLFSVSEFF
jgi:hypothetical protein